jgi:hypothetical protein
MGVAYLVGNPRVLLKRSSGQLNFLSYILFWPYHILNFLGLWLFRLIGRENAYDKVAENLYLGCTLSNGDRTAIEKIGIHAVLDLTCEFTEPKFLQRMNAYKSIPVLDTRAPTTQQLREASVWLEEQTAKGSVYVHCAFGHSRSATFVVAYLLSTKQANSTEEALCHITMARSKVKLSESQIVALKEFQSTLIASNGFGS